VAIANAPAFSPAELALMADLARDLDARERQGAASDTPEGARTITVVLSDTLARQISARLRAIAGPA